MGGYKGRDKTPGAVAEESGPSTKNIDGTHGGTDTHAGVEAEVTDKYEQSPDQQTGQNATATLDQGATPLGERFVFNFRDNKPLVAQTVSKVIRKVMGPITDTSSGAEIIAVLNHADLATGAERSGLQSEFLPSSLGATSTGVQSVAQMRLFERALAALSDAERRLSALRPMQTPSDPENLDALRAITLATYRRLVKEFGREGGPRVERADQYFSELIGVAPFDPSDLEGLLRKIHDQFKIDSGVNTAEDNANVANFRIVMDNFFDVERSWTNFKKESGDDYGAQSAKFSRLLKMIEDDVADVERALDEVNFDESDRDNQPIEETVPVRDETITIQGLLSWISEFAAEEGPEMVDQGGALGIAATHSTLGMLVKLVDTLMGLNEIHVKAAKVHASLDVLLTHLEQAELRANTVKGSIKP